MAEMVQMADGREVPKACVDALDEFENVWPGATFHNARAAISFRVLKAAGVDRMRKMLNELGFCPDCGEALPCVTCGHGL